MMRTNGCERSRGAAEWILGAGLVTIMCMFVLLYECMACDPDGCYYWDGDSWEPGCETGLECCAGQCIYECLGCLGCDIETGDCEPKDELCTGECYKCSTAVCIDDDTKCTGGSTGGCYDCDDGTCTDMCEGTNTPHCDEANDQCVECMDDDDCSEPSPYCEGKHCVECRSDSDCNGELETCGTCNAEGACIDDDSKCGQCGYCYSRICHPDDSKCSGCEKCFMSLTCDDWDPKCAENQVCIEAECVKAGVCIDLSVPEEGMGDPPCTPLSGLSCATAGSEDDCMEADEPVVRVDGQHMFECSDPPNECESTDNGPYCMGYSSCVWDQQTEMCSPYEHSGEVTLWTDGQCRDKYGTYP